MQKKVLIIAAHPDDEVLGCGGSMAKLIELGHEVRLCILSSGEGARAINQTTERYQALENIKLFYNIKKSYQFNFKDNQFDVHSMLELTQAIESVAIDYQPHIVYTHSAIDLNIDHRLTNQATLTAFRPLPGSCIEKILAYEVLSSTELSLSSSFRPNYFETLSKNHCDIKLNAMQLYRNEIREFPHPRSIKAIESLMICRGTSIGESYAEAFIIEREIKRN